MQPLKFWLFVWRSMARAMSDTVRFFGWDMKTVVTTVALLILGFFIYWKVKGAAETKDELAKYALFIIVPYAVFIVGMLAVQTFRAPYLIYKSEFSKSQQQVHEARQAQADAETAKASSENARQVAEAKARDLDKRLTECQNSKSVVPSQPRPAMTSLTDGQRFALKHKLHDLKGHSISIALIGHAPQAEILFEQLQDIFKEAEWIVSTTQIGQQSVAGASPPTTSFISGSNVAAPVVGSVFSIFSSLGINLPLVPRAFLPAKTDVVIVVQ